MFLFVQKNIIGILTETAWDLSTGLRISVRLVQSLSQVLLLFATPWTAARQVSLSISWSLLKLMSIESVMPSNHLILCRPLLLPSIFPSIRVFSKESALHIRWPKYWSFSFNISSSNEHPRLISFYTSCNSRVFMNSQSCSICGCPGLLTVSGLFQWGNKLPEIFIKDFK